MNLHKMIEIYLKYDNMHIFVVINALICINNYVITCINSMLSRATRGSATWPQCRVTPTRWSRAPRQHICSSRLPRQHLQVRNSLNKNQIKIRKRHKLQKFITLNIQLLFNPNFLHWITNFFLFNIMSFKIYFQRRNQDELEFT